MTQIRDSVRTEPYNRAMEITPSMAERWLEANENNRRINWNHVSQLARDMKAGRFACTHQGIAFNTEGHLIDGQHRLWAIVDAEVPVRMRVFFNEPPDNMVLIDGHSRRTAADRMTMGHTLGSVRVDELATLRAMMGGIAMATAHRTVHEEMELLEKHRTAVRFAHEYLPNCRTAGIVNCMTRAVVARAWYCVSEHWLLSRFCEVFRTGLSSGERERPIVLLRNQLIEIRRHKATRETRQRQYALTSRALLAYVDDEMLNVLRAPSYELFLLPDEVEAAA